MAERMRSLLPVLLILPILGFLVAAVAVPVSSDSVPIEKAVRLAPSLDSGFYKDAARAPSDEWSKYEMYVMKKLEDIDKRLACIEDRTNDNSLAVGVLNVKAGMWGGIGGIGTSLLTVLSTFLVNRRGRRNGGVAVERCED